MSAAWRCPAIVVEEEIADELVATIKELAQERKVGPAWDESTEMGPLVNQGHKEFVEGWIEKSIEEGATPVLDGREASSSKATRTATSSARPSSIT